MDGTTISSGVGGTGNGQYAVLWAGLARVRDWHDAHDQAVRIGDAESLLLRLGKIAEEVGEVWEAVIGVTGQNPRKGVTHGMADVVGEVCDVILAAAHALLVLLPEDGQAGAAVLDRLNMVLRRAEQHGMPATPG